MPHDLMVMCVSSHNDQDFLRPSAALPIVL